ncbi:hypothetical protein C4K17_4478 [Pseudomonas chlororaphis subsp. aurantiaca]|nr:hypothetical protein C4K17_4478 [Pseudomonas chlororaphis subsp. aurantiaca]
MPVQVQRLCYLGRTSEVGGKLGPMAGLRGGRGAFVGAA